MLLLISSAISGKTVNLDKLALIVVNGDDVYSCWNTFMSFVLAVVTSPLGTISRYLRTFSVSLVCSREIALHCWNTKFLIAVAIDPWMSGVGLIFIAKKLGSAILMRVITRCLLSWILF